MKKVKDVNIMLADNPTRDFGILVLAVGMKIPKGADPKDGFNEIATIEVAEWRRRVRVTYTDGSTVIYKGFRLIYGELSRG